MHTKMNASHKHLNGCGVDIYYASMPQSNAHKCQTTHLAFKDLLGSTLRTTKSRGVKLVLLRAPPLRWM